MGKQQQMGEVGLSRKQQRKQGRKDKMQKKAAFFSHKHHDFEQPIHHHSIHHNKHPSNKVTKRRADVRHHSQNIYDHKQMTNPEDEDEDEELYKEHIEEEQGIGGDKGMEEYWGEDGYEYDVGEEEQVEEEDGGMDLEGEDDQMIKYYEQKLEMSDKTAKKNKTILRENGLEDDFFDFLDNITKKLKSKKGDFNDSSPKAKDTKNSKKTKLRKKKQEEMLEEEAEWEENDNQESPEWEEYEGDPEWQNFEEEDALNEPGHQQPTITQLPRQPKTKQKTESPTTPLTSNQQQEQRVIRKNLNSLLNKVSDGNILKISREVNTVFVNNAKSRVFPCFVQLFLKFNIENPKLLIHILAANVALACSLHHLYDNQFFSQLISHLITRFDHLQQTEEVIMKTEDEVEMNEVLEKKKNCIKVFCYMYMLSSITIDFVKELFLEVSSQITHSNIELLYLLVTTVGSKIREDDPKVLKDIISSIQDQISLSRNQGYQQNNKVKFILHQLNQLKLNKKCLVDPDQRFNFLSTFIKKNVLAENGINANVFIPSLLETRSADKAKAFWWEPMVKERKEEELEMRVELTEEQRYLEDLARQQKMVTEKKKKIFVSIMKAEDYLEATENILQLKIRNPSEVAEVIVEVCSQEKAFNLFYVYLSSKLIECSVRYKNGFKFALWNQQTQLQNYNFRKISNLAKFTARLIILSDQCSLAFLKNTGDMMNLDKFMQIFLTVLLQEFFENVELDRLDKLMAKIRTGSNNRDFKRNLLEYLSEDYYKYCRQSQKPYKDKVKFSVRLLSLTQEEVEDREDREERD